MKALNKILELVFPSKCLSCDALTEKSAGDFSSCCLECFGRIRLNRTFFCGLCRARLPEGKRICHQGFPFVLGAAGEYADETLRALILGFKFKRVKEASEPLSRLVASYLELLPKPWREFTFVPIPLNRQREKERGFNQSEIMARTIAKSLGCGVEAGNLIRVKNTKPQSETGSYRERSQNIEAAFKLLKSREIRGRKIVVLDDVITSGATLTEAVRLLKTSHPKEILAITVAKA